MAAKANKKNSNSFADEIIIILLFGISVFFLISCFGYGGKVGNIASNLLFGLFGIGAYIFPVLLFVGGTFLISNKKNKVATIKFVAAVFLYIAICTFAQAITYDYIPGQKILEIYAKSKEARYYGGLLGGAITSLLFPLIGKIGTYILIIITTIVSLVLISEHSFLRGIEKGSKKIYDTAKNDANRRRKQRQAVKNEVSNEEKPDNKSFRRKSSGVTFDTKIENKEQKPSDSMRELINSGDFSPENAICIDDIDEIINESDTVEEVNYSPEIEEIEEVTYIPEIEEAEEVTYTPELVEIDEFDSYEEVDDFIPEPVETNNIIDQEKAYEFPPIDLLKKGDSRVKGDSDSHLQETVNKLQNTLKNFGVNVKITDVSCGPTVTRYEIQPEKGVKVSKIVNLADDIKLNLAATDIRIEAPIPGKAAIGIEVPNKTNVSVMLRDLIETNEFKNSTSKLSFAAGKDIGGKVVVTDIAKMPHLLIAGATGSGKSVCINTIIMSILYKARPDEVKLIMIDPKVVELSIYNGIPHLMIPVVTDPKKAAGALQWGVNEMLDRYQKFADLAVRDLEHYNLKITEAKKANPDSELEVLPQILIIVDELADLMMAAPGEVEDSICRLAQLARAAGIHLVIATQRPSVNVITGLIKANMPSRMAFSVSSGIDSRTILDMVGAEKLLGKGDMLFYPQGYPKPVRVQGAFVSENEVNAVVEFLSSQNKKVVYNSEIEERINNAQVNSNTTHETDEFDSYFLEAGKYIIEKDKASIGLLQRVFKIGFNRAARIMDQLASVGVVGEEEGTKPRKILMTMEEFEQFIEERY